MAFVRTKSVPSPSVEVFCGERCLRSEVVVFVFNSGENLACEWARFFLWLVVSG